jgi:antibiotic biosynthesis monooxygenase (ABM) superfamily enzyme
MIITLFGDAVVRPGKEAREERLHQKLESIVEAMPGFISMKYYVADDGEEIGVIRFDSRESLDGWMKEGSHAAAQTLGPTFYERFWIQTAETYREYRWEGEKRIEEDLTYLFT